MKQALTRGEAAALLDVSAETADRLGVYLEVLAKWTPRINLVAASTMDDPWRRHIVDSGQLFRLLGEGAETLADLGSGAGLPGLILAIMGVPQVHLVESDQRKCAFLREAARLTGASVTIHATRIEAAPALAADIVTARALAPLDKLLPMAARFLKSGGRCLFLKGGRYLDELTAAEESWHMDAAAHDSLSDPDGAVLSIQSLVPRQS